ncbi:MAG TPA: hypothetical protein VH637_04290 [Streptosporangiaceae bacterium]|jgi:hypothetical protein
MKSRILACALGAGGLVLGTLTAGQGLAAAAVQQGGTQTCTGTLAAPGQLSGSYSNLVIDGACAIQNGPVHVSGNLTVAPNAILNAVFGANGSRLTVDGNMVVQDNASVMLGCGTVFANLWGLHGVINVPEFPCLDDPNPGAPTLTSLDVIHGNLIVNQALGVVLHDSTVDGNVTQTGGGGGESCDPAGVFNQDVGFPPYSSYIDSTVHGNVTVTNLTTCWFGMFRNQIGGNAVNTNIVNGDIDGNEDEGNIIHGNFSCQNNSPADQWGDGDSASNQVAGNATGMCGFDVQVLNPAPEAGVIGVTPVPIHVSVPLR